MARYNSVMVHEKLDKETGEIVSIETRKSFSYKCTEDNFFMVFYKYLRGTIDLKSFKAFQVLLELVSLADFNTGEVSLTPVKRKRICDVLQISKCNLSTHLKSLSKCGLIIGKQSDYKINPQIFWKGELTKRKDLMESKDFYVEFGFRDRETGEPVSFNQDIEE